MKRILSLDGGGIRGVFTLQVLARIEEIFRRVQGRPELVLADVFDLIAGTSTGAIIATCLSWGMPVRDVEALYISQGPAMFARQQWYRRWKCKYRADAIAKVFQALFREEDDTPARLGTKKLRTLLLVIMRNASTGSSWPVSNNPKARFNQRCLRDCNLDIPLWQLLRASTAAPTFFPPEQIILDDCKHLFVDGGITPYNNPALAAVLMATLPQYRLEWSATRQDLHVVSIGTGRVRPRLPLKIAEKIHLFDQLRFFGPALISSVAMEQDMLCRVLGDCVFGTELDQELGELNAPSLLPPSQQKFTYARYDCPLDAPAGRQGGPLGRISQRLAGMNTELDNLALIPLLRDIGGEYAQSSVLPEHLQPRPVAGLAHASPA